ncbi:DUF2157 domain-containing protein [Zobellella maritima]|uniref:DUF2157 domain-containing protein n=1 Tax=Zobellella maritima TaxID=2059725 RepID=UPI000E308EDC|nr:DUF2157 domain-containing protein [Zobellella maritima]
MHLDKHKLKRAADRGLLRPEQVEPLWRFLTAQDPRQTRFQFSHILYYLGGLMAIGAMSLFMTLGWQQFGGWALVTTGLLYALAGLGLTEWFRARRLFIPTGICAVLVVVLTPLTLYGWQYAQGWWEPGGPYPMLFGSGHWRPLSLELATLAVAAIMLWRYRLPLLMLPLAATLWFLVLDTSGWLLDERPEVQQWASLWCGLLMTMAAIRIELANDSRQDFAFWLYLWGGTTFWAGLSLLQLGGNEPGPEYLVGNLLMILLGTLLVRRILVGLGGLGTAWYLGYLAWEVFADSLLFPLALTAIGLAVMGLGIFWQRHQRRLTERLLAMLPPRLSALLARRAED